MGNADQSEHSEGAGKPAEAAMEGIILVDLTLQPIAVDDEGRVILSELGEANAGHPLPGLPPQLKSALLAVAPEELNATTLRIRVEDFHYSCEVFVLQPQNAILREPLLAIYVKKEPSIDEAMRRAGRLYRLTEREQETLLGIASGLTSRQIAEKMGISPNTVNAFLRLIMVKMGVTTRAGVVGKLINENRARAQSAASAAPHSQQP